MRVRVPALAFVLGLAAEIVVFVLVAQWIGFGLALLAVIATSVLGGVLGKREGTRAWRRFRAVTEAGERPGPHLTRSLVGLLAAVLLFIPGFITDVIGLALLLPPVRTLAAAGVTNVATRRLGSGTVGTFLGPRRVRVRAGRPTRDPTIRVTVPDTGRPGTAGGPAAGGYGEAIEGEIIDPR